MNVSDPIADMLTRIRNASRAHHTEVVVPASRVKREIARILVEEGFIARLRARSGTGPPSSCGSTSSTSTARRRSSPG